MTRIFRRIGLRRASFAALLGGISLLAPAALAVSRELPAEFRDYPFSVQSLSVGRPNAGFLVRPARLRSSEHLKLKPGSERHVYGHPALVLMLKRTAKQMARAVPGSVMLVGDLSSEEGGPLQGHFSHQSGRDADVGFYVRDREGNSVVLDRFVAFDGQGRAKDGSGLVFDDHRNWLLLQSWVKDDRAGLAHVFVSAELRARLVRFARANPEFRPYVTRALQLLKQPERASAHADHFHVRIRCPDEQLGLCKNESSRR